jgi:AcrR family transcriptional regulator
MFSNDTPGTKAERTRALIRDVALRSFRVNGFDATTMRSIATEAGVSLGNAYYYFPTKNHLVQELYMEVQEAHRAAVEPLLATTDDLVDRLGLVYRTGLEQLVSFHGFAPGFLSAMVPPKSPLNPLSADSGPAREIVVGLFQDAVTNAKHTLPAEFVPKLPQVLWLGYLLLSLYWVYDNSANQKRTDKLLTQGLRLLKLTLPLIRMPLVRGPIRALLDVVAEAGA